MSRQATLRAKIDATGAVEGGKRVEKSIHDIRSAATGMASRVKSSLTGLTDSIFSLRGAFVALGAIGIAKSFIDAAASAEQFQIRLRVVLGDVGEANKLFAEMTDLAANTRFTFEEIMNSAADLGAVVKDGAAGIARLMPMILDIAAATGIGVKEVTMNVMKLWSGGAGAVEAFRDRGILAMMGFERGVDYSIEETRAKFIEAMTGMDSKFKGSATALANTWEGQVSMMQDKWFEFRLAVMNEGLFDFLKASMISAVSVMGKELDSGERDYKQWSDMGISAVESITTAMYYGVRAVQAMGIAVRLLTTGWQELSNIAKPMWGQLLADEMRQEGARATQIQKQLREAIDARMEYKKLEESGKPLNNVQQRFADGADAEIERLTVLMNESSQKMSAYQERLRSINTDDVREQNKKLAQSYEDINADFEKLLDPALFEKFKAEREKAFKELQETRKLTTSTAPNAEYKMDPGAGAPKPLFDDAESDKWEAIRDQYDKAGAAAREYAEAVQYINRAYSGGAITPEEYATMMRAATVEYEAAIEATNEMSAAQKEAQKEWDSLISKYDEGGAAATQYAQELNMLNQKWAEGTVEAEQYALMHENIRQAYIDALPATKELIESQSEYLSLLKSTDTDLEAYSRGMMELEELREKLIKAGENEVEVNERIARAQQNLAKEYQAARGFTLDLQKAGEQLGLTFASAFEDAIVDGADVSDMLEGLADDLVRLTVRMLILQPLLAGMGQALQGFALSFGSAGANTPPATVPVPVPAGSTRVASGGPIRSGKLHLVGEQGPEFFIPEQDGYVTNAATTREMFDDVNKSASTQQYSSTKQQAMTIDVNIPELREFEGMMLAMSRKEAPKIEMRDFNKSVVQTATTSDSKTSAPAAESKTTINVHNYTDKSTTVDEKIQPDGQKVYDIVVGAATEDVRRRGSLYRAMNATNRLNPR